MGGIDLPQRPFGRLAIELEPAREPLRQAAEEQVRVGDRGLAPAAAVARGPRMRSRAPRADAESAAGVDPGDRAAAGADGVQVDGREPDGQPADVLLRRPPGGAAEHETNVRGRAAHVERDGVLDSGETADPSRAHDACGRPRDERDRRMCGDLLQSRHAARRPHHERRRQALLGAAAGERPRIPGHDRSEVGVRGRRRGALELAELRRDLVRCHDVRVRKPTPELVDDRLLVRRVAEREEQADGDRLSVQLGQRGEVELLDDAVGAHSLANAEAALERHQRLGVRLAEPVEVGSGLAA